MIIGITGAIGSGKSYVLKEINEIYHYDIYSCDEFTRLAYEDEKIIKKLDASFKCVSNNKVNKEILKENLNDDNLKTLNEIIHPFVIIEILKIKAKYQNNLAFIEVPLLFEANLSYLFDKTISLYVEDEIRYKRLKARDNKNFEFLLNLEKKQLSQTEKCARANFVLKRNENDTYNLKMLNGIINILIKGG